MSSCWLVNCRPDPFFLPPRLRPAVFGWGLPLLRLESWRSGRSASGKMVGFGLVTPHAPQ